MQETVVWPLGWEDPLEEEMSTHSSNFALKIPRTEEPRGLQFIGLQRIGHNWATKHACTQLTNNFKSMPLPNIMPPLSNVKDYLTLSPQNTQSPFVHLLMTLTLLAKSHFPFTALLLYWDIRLHSRKLEGGKEFLYIYMFIHKFICSKIRKNTISLFTELVLWS